MAVDASLLARALELIERHHGLTGPSARPPAWVAGRLAAGLEAMALASAVTTAEIVSRLEQDAALRGELAELLRVGETRLFRDAAQWQALRRELVPKLQRRRALSAGCSTGEEAWTLAMLLDEAGHGSYRVVGVDRSVAALAAARHGIYPRESARELPLELATRYLEMHAEGVAVAPSLHEKVTFAARDLLQGAPPGEFDVIACKNVLIYLAEEAGNRLLSVLRAALAENGVLLVARSEVPRVRRFGFAARELAPGVTVFTAG